MRGSSAALQEARRIGVEMIGSEPSTLSTSAIPVWYSDLISKALSPSSFIVKCSCRNGKKANFHVLVAITTRQERTTNILYVPDGQPSILMFSCRGAPMHRFARASVCTIQSPPQPDGASSHALRYRPPRH